MVGNLLNSYVCVEYEIFHTVKSSKSETNLSWEYQNISIHQLTLMHSALIHDAIMLHVIHSYYSIHICQKICGSEIYDDKSELS